MFSFSIIGAKISGVARLGHTGARALATRGHAPLVYASELSALTLIVSLSIANRAPNRLESEQRSIVIYPQDYESRTLFFFWAHMRHTLHYDMASKDFLGQHAPDPNASANSRKISYKRTVVCPCCALALPMSWLRHWQLQRE